MEANSASARDLFVQKNSPDGLFLRYARGRLRGFANRQVVVLLGSGLASLLIEFWLGPISLIMALLGEAPEAWLLSRALRRGGPLSPGLRRLAVLAASFQSLMIAGASAMCWLAAPVAEAHFLALIFLMSGVTNAGLPRRHFPEGARARFWIYGLTTGFLLLNELSGGLRIHGIVVLLAALVLGFNNYLFLRTVGQTQHERYRFQKALLEEQEALEKSRAALERTARLSERLAYAARFAGDSVIFISPAGQIEWVNEAFTRITGYSFDEAVGQLPADLLDSESAAREDVDRLREARVNGVACRVELQNRTRDGRLIWMDINMSPVMGADGRPEVFISVERDVTQAKAHEAEIAAARHTAEAALQTKSQFLATMSHEIRTPLNGVIGVAELLADTRLDATQQQYVATIIESGRSLLMIINDVLDLSRLGAGKMPLAAEPFSLTGLIGASIDLLGPVAQRKGISLTADLPDDLPQYLGDAGRLRQVLLNLIGNAVKFTASGGVAVSVERDFGMQPEQIRLHIRDTGIGIPPDRQEHVFDSFAQADSTISRRFGGTGLGLTISRELVRRMGGDITLQSTTGEGAVFTIAVPLLAVAPRIPATVADVPRPSTRLQVMVAEDNRTNMMIVRKLLEPCVGRLWTAVDGETAIGTWRGQPLDLILMDISMPRMDGMTAARVIRCNEAREGRKPVPIYALTAYSSPEDLAAFKAAGMDGALSKPFVRNEIYALLFRIAGATVPSWQDSAAGLPFGHATALRSGAERSAEGGRSWSISPQGFTTTTGRSTRSSGH